MPHTLDMGLSSFLPINRARVCRLCLFLASPAVAWAGVGWDQIEFEEPPPVAQLFPPIEKILGRTSFWAQSRVRATDAKFKQAMASPDPVQRAEAADSLGYPNDDEAVPLLGEILQNGREDKSVRASAAIALGRIGDERGRRFLAESIDDEQLDVRFASVLALSRLGFTGDEKAIEKTLRSDPAWWVRYAAAAALGKARRTFAIEALAQAAREDPQWQVRMQAANSLGEIGGEPAAESLAAPLSDRDEGVRASAAMALAEIGGPKSLILLRRAAAQERSDFARQVINDSVRRVLAKP